MANKAADRFVLNLRASIGKWKMPDETLALYQEMLGKWHLSEDIWRQALETIIEQNEKGELPPLAQIYPILKSAQSAVSAGDGAYAYFCYRLRDHDYAAKVWRDGETWRLMKVRRDEKDHNRWWMEKSDQVARPPEGATDVHLALPEELQTGYEACSAADGRKYFLAGWIRSGADPAKCEAALKTLKE